MTNIVVFTTKTQLPLDAFTTFGVNVKPNSSSPFGFFGTGLKYAVSVILRNRGTFRLFVDGVEYEFYLRGKEFRGKEFEQVRMRKRKPGMKFWMKSTMLPFTTELGKNWKLWQAYRELESNTRDENGWTDIYTDEDISEAGGFSPGKGQSHIVVECDGFYESTMTTFEDHGNREVSSGVFLNYDNMTVAHDCHRCTIYHGASKHIYYQGIRVYDLRNPSRYTYDFKPGFCTLSEDRSAKNIWDMQYWLAHEIQRIENKELLEDMLNGDEPELWFETDDLTFYGSGHYQFKNVALGLGEGRRVSRSIKGYIGTYCEPEDDSDDELTLNFLRHEVDLICNLLDKNPFEVYETAIAHEVLDKIKGQL